MARLILQTAEGQQAIDLRPVNSLGRHPNNSIQLLDKIVSKEHCIIEARGDRWVLRDLGSLNGTFVNNERVRGEAPLKHGDEIALGATKGRFDDGAAPLPSSIPMPGNQAGWPQGAAPGSAGPQTPPAQPPAQPGAGPSPLAQSAHGPIPPPAPTFGAMAAMGPGPGPQPPGMVPQPYQPYARSGGPPGQPPPMVAPRPGGYPPQPQPYSPQPPQPPHQGGTGPGGTGPIPPVGGGTGPLHVARQGQHGAHSYLAQGTRIDLNDQARAIGTQIAAIDKGFLPFDRIVSDQKQLQADYERLRLSHELSREIAAERDTQ